MVALRGLTLAALVATAAGCPTRIDPPRDALTDPEAVLELAEGRLHDVRSLTIHARVSYFDDDGAKKGRMDIIAMRPGNLFFVAVDPAGTPLGALAVKDGRFTSFQRGGEVCQVGRACPENVGRMLPIAMEPERVVDVLMGAAPTIPAESRRVEWDSRAGAYCVVLTGEGGAATQQVWIQHGTGLVVRTRLVRSGKQVFDLRFEEPKTVAGHLIAHELRLEMAHRNIDLKLDYRQVAVNDEEITAESFALGCPEGTQLQELPCMEPPQELAPPPEDQDEPGDQPADDAGDQEEAP